MWCGIRVRFPLAACCRTDNKPAGFTFYETTEKLKTMTTTKFKGTPVHIDGEFIRVGVQAPDFELVRGDLSPLKLSDLKGKRVVLNIFPSLDTGVCATSVRKFNKLASSLSDTVVVAVSKDLPFVLFN